MKIAHISDLHLGYATGRMVNPETKTNLREQDGYDAYLECIDDIVQNGEVDAVLCTGDFFHRPHPSIKSIAIGFEGLYRLSDAGIPFYNLAGNHDATDSRRDVPANRVLHNPRLSLFSHVEPYIVHTVGKDGDRDVNIHLISHHAYSTQKQTMEQVKPIDGAINILATHGSCFDTEINGLLHTEASPREVVIPEDVLQLGWDYVLMGHIHERGWVNSQNPNSPKRYYAGSLVRRGFADKHCPLGKGWTLWTIENGEMTHNLYSVKQRPQFDRIVYCDGKDALEIESELIELFRSLPLTENPIVRVTMSEFSSKQKHQLDWTKLGEYTEQCLTFNIKIKTKEEVRQEIAGISMSFDLLKAYDEFFEANKDRYEEKDREVIYNSSKELLRQGRDKVLD